MRLWTLAALLLAVPACGSDPVKKPASEMHDECETDPDACEPDPAGENYLFVTVSAERPTYVNLATRSVVELDDPAHSSAWDLSFRGYDIYTNGGISGPGAGRAFGPLPSSYFAFPDETISTPFLIEDRAEGAFLRWYAYDGSDHTIYSRYHVYGIRSGGALYKLQVMSYYGEQAGAPVSARYRLRYAEVSDAGSSDTRELEDIDGTVEDGESNPDAPSGCVTLHTGESTQLTPAEAEASSAWDLCFRRDAVTVNGELGGPGGVTAVDLLQDANEPIEDVRALRESEIDARFEVVDAATLDAPELDYRGDYTTSAFTRKWVDRTTDPPVPFNHAWLVVGANGGSRYLVGFSNFEGANADSPGTLKLYVHPSP